MNKIVFYRMNCSWLCRLTLKTLYFLLKLILLRRKVIQETKRVQRKHFYLLTNIWMMFTKKSWKYYQDHLMKVFVIYFLLLVPSVLWRCWMCGRKGIRPVKNWVVGCWCGYLPGAQCRLAYGPADATATHCLVLQWNPDWFCLSGTGSPG